MRRRELCRMMMATGALAALPSFARATGEVVQLRFDPNRTGATIPRDFVGLSFERAQLSNPGYFSPANTALVGLVRGLSTAGNLRLGGSSGEHTAYIGDTTRPPPFEIFGPEHNKTIKEGMFVSTAALRTLRGFLDATGWNCLYGLNLAHATPEQAAREAADVQRILGPRLLALQIGNEPDAFRNRFRPAEWGPRDFLAEWDRFHAAIAAAAPGVKFAGPDISNKLDYLTAFAGVAHLYPDLLMLTGHYYAMGPAGSPDATLDQLMAPDPKTTTLPLAGVETVQAAVRTARLPYRMAEGNSCWDGGKSGVSDVHAAAIWGADTMLRFAQRGWIGVNWHGGGNGIYAPIVGAPSSGFTRRPLYFGTQFAQALDGATFLDTGATPADPYLGYYALRQGGRTRIAVINKRDAAVTVQLPGLPEAKRTVLTGPSATARDATTLTTRSERPARTVVIPPLTAMLFTLVRR
ncbi:hypothetical protein [Sphingomonas hengshuiensis]|uniref:hypothetical protein n=1 Tax=Sphingomonas hengshuiensis TaxID=1609977 RepID=UPI000AA56C51|nr:hypothetical protein [Sphingomonas hengshuiensis]